jgi:hypothetical protein
MLTKSMIAIAAAALALTIALPGGEAQAKTDVDINVGIGFGGFIDPGYGYGYAGVGYDHDYAPDYVSCSQARKVVRWNGFKGVKALDCSAPSYRFSGWKSGKKYSIKVNGWGDITGVKSY